MVILRHQWNIFSLYFIFTFVCGDWTLQVYNNGPIILDSSIEFTAYLEGEDDYEENDKYIYIFSDNTGVTEKKEILSGKNVSFTFSCNETLYKTGTYAMTVTMKERKFDHLTNVTLFTLTESVPGQVIFHQDGLPPDESCSNCVSSNKNINFTAVIHDPAGYFTNASFLFYIWVFQDKSFLADNTVVYNFTSSGQKEIEVMLVVLVKGKTKLGNLKRILDVKDPIGNLNITGVLAFRHGHIFNVNVSCNGSGPYQYCLRLFKPNETFENATCTDITMTTSCLISYQRYLPVVGSYHLFVYLRNDVNIMSKVVDVEVFDISHKPLLSAMIIPVVCSIIAIIIIAAGIVYHIHYRKTHTVEVADFDFQQEDDWTERTFFEHICDSLKKNAFSHKFSSANKKQGYNTFCSQDEDASLINPHPTS